MKNILKYFGLFALSLNFVYAERSFYIDYEANTFVKDGKPFKYISGSIHSYRVPKDLWEDRLTKMWASGLNAIQTYVFWNEHELTRGVYDFEGQYNIFEFIEIAQKIGFVVILRPGPYICGEHEFGGLPWWLLSNGTESIVPRSSEKNYMNAVNTWFEVLLPKIVPYLYKNGGPIITVQVENEYGAYYTCDNKYKNELRDLFQKYFGNDTVLFTTDSYVPTFHFVCGVIDGVYSTIDFGIDKDVNASFNLQRKFSPKGPLVNSEFYPGWLDFWGYPHQKRDTQLVIAHLQKMLNFGANVNFYMFHGGTNFGFSNGVDPPFFAQPTSYDYDAPISEAGDITQKYLAIREEISKYLPIPQVPIPKNSTKLSLGKIKISTFSPLFDTLTDYCKDTSIITEKPTPFEKLGQGYGVVMYSTNLTSPNVDGKVLSIKGIRDRAYIQIGNKFVGVISRIEESLRINLPNNRDVNLRILVENIGRLNYEYLFDTKGIISDVTLEGTVLNNWSHCLTKDIIPYFQIKTDHQQNFLSRTYKDTNQDFKLPGIYTIELDPVTTNSFDTFLKLDKFKKGVAMINNGTVLTNLGRYWPVNGPQVTLYSPGAFFSTTEKNHVYLIDFEGSLCESIDDCFIEFINYPIIDKY